MGSEGAEDGEEVALVGEVEEGGGFVEEEDAGLLGEGGGEEDALFFAAGESAEIAMAEGFAIHLGESGVGLGEVLIAFEPASGVGRAAHEDDLFDGEGEGEIEGGFDEGDLAGEGAAVDFRDGLAAEEDFAGLGREMAREQTQERAFAGAVGAEDGNEFAGVGREG